MTATVSLEISDYLPSGFNYEGFNFGFRTENFEDTIEWSKKNQIMAGILNLKKDRKFTIRVTKNGSVVGISEIVLPQMLLLKREENFTKIVSISMIDSVKKSLLGKDWTKTLQIGVRAKIEYREENFQNNSNEPRSSSARHMGSAYLENSADKRVSPNKARLSTSGGRKSVKNNVQVNYARGSIFVMKDKNQKPEVVDEYGDLETTFIDSIFNDEQNTDFEGVEKTLNEFILEFNNLSKQASEESDPELLIEKTKFIIPKLFDLQKLYYTQFNMATKSNRRLKELLITYNEKYRTIFKKSNRLREALESNKIRNELTSFINKQECIKHNESLRLYRSEIDIFKNLFKIDYSKNELANYKKVNSINRDEEEKQSLLIAIQNIIQNPSLLEKVPEDKKIQLSYLASKYGVKSINKRSEDDEGEKMNNKFSSEKVNRINLDYEDEDQAEGPSDSPGKNKLSIVQSSTNDIFDKKLDDFLVGIYIKRRISQIPFRRLSQGEYEFGSQKILLKIDGEIIRVKTGGGFILLDKFIEIHAPLEEAKIIRAQNNSDKNKTNSGIKKVLGSEKNSNELQPPGKNNIGIVTGSKNESLMIKKK